MTDTSPAFGNPKIESAVRVVATQRENGFLRLMLTLALGGILSLGGIVWAYTTNQVAKNTERIDSNAQNTERRFAAFDLRVREIELARESDRREDAAERAETKAWLRAIARGLNIHPPPPGSDQ